eukprot:scaffold34989_cov118-Isochrysis_galbana.AAC.6
MAAHTWCVAIYESSSSLPSLMTFPSAYEYIGEMPISRPSTFDDDPKHHGANNKTLTRNNTRWRWGAEPFLVLLFCRPKVSVFLGTESRHAMADPAARSAFEARAKTAGADYRLIRAAVPARPDESPAAAILSASVTLSSQDHMLLSSAQRPIPSQDSGREAPSLVTGPWGPGVPEYPRDPRQRC